MKDEKYKDSCKYAIDISKLFITLSVATIGFVVTLIFSRNSYFSSGSNIALLILLGISVLSGILFLMSVVAHINQTENYNVYTFMLRFLSGGQIIFFLIAITVICVQIFRLPYNRQIEGSSEIRIEINGKKVEYNILPNTKIKLIIDENGKIELQNI